MRSVAGDVHQLRGMPPNTINVYLVGGVLVDAGTPAARASGSCASSRGHEVSAHVVTHAHPDHFGSSHAVCEALALPLLDRRARRRGDRDRQPGARAGPRARAAGEGEDAAAHPRHAPPARGRRGRGLHRARRARPLAGPHRAVARGRSHADLRRRLLQPAAARPAAGLPDVRPASSTASRCAGSPSCARRSRCSATARRCATPSACCASPPDERGCRRRSSARHELDRIAAALDAAVAGSGRTLLIEGPAGIGKTRLRAGRAGAGEDRAASAGCTRPATSSSSAIAWAVAAPDGRALAVAPRSRTRAQRCWRAPPARRWRRSTRHRPRRRRRRGDRRARCTRCGGSSRPRVVAAAADLRRRRAVVRPAVAALPRLPRAAHRRPADRARRSPRARRSERRGPLAELTAARVGERLVPAPAVARRRRDPAALRCTTAAGGRGRRRDPRASGGNPFLARVLLDDLGARGANARRSAHGSDRQRPRPERDLRARCSPACPPTRSRWPAPPPCSARAATAGWRRRSPSCSDAPLAAAMDALVAGHVLFERCAASSSSCTRSCARRCSRSSARARAPRCTRRPRGRCTTAARASRASPRTSPMRRWARCRARRPAARGRRLAARRRRRARPRRSTSTARSRHAARSDEAIEARARLSRCCAAGEPERARVHLRSAAAAARRPARAQADLPRGRRLGDVARRRPGGRGRRAARAARGWPQSDADPARLVLEARLRRDLLDAARGERRRSASGCASSPGLPGETPEQRTLLALLAQRERYDVGPARRGRRDRRAARSAQGAYLEDVADGADGMVGWVVAMMALIAADGLELATAELARARERVRDRGSPLEFGMVSNVAAAIGWRTGDVIASGGRERGVAGRRRRRGRLARPSSPCARRRRTSPSGRRSSAASVARPRRRCSSASTSHAADAPPLIPVTWLRARRALARAGVRRAPARAGRGAGARRGRARRARRHPDRRRGASGRRAGRAAPRRESAARELAERAARARAPLGHGSELGAALCVLARVDGDRRIALLTEAIAALDARAGAAGARRARSSISARRCASRAAARRRTPRWSAAPSSPRRAARASCASARWRDSRRSETARASSCSPARSR